MFRAKVCPGNHQHSTIEGQETAATSYYPWRMVQAIARHWKQQFAPPRHQRLLEFRHDLHDPGDSELIESDNESFTMDYDVNEFHDSAHVTEAELLGLTSPSEDQHATSGESFGLTSPSEDQHATSGESFRAMILHHLAQSNYSIDALEQVLLAASRLHQGKSATHSRWSVRRGSVLVLGAYSHGHLSGVSRSTLKNPELVRYLNGFFNKHLPNASSSSFMVSFDCPALPHRDYHNMKGSENHLICVGSFGKGGLWVSGSPPAHLPSVRRRMPDGHVHEGYVLPTRHQLVSFDPQAWHSSQAWDGYRIAVSAYTTRLALDLAASDSQCLRQLGFPPLRPLHQAMTATAASLPENVDEVVYKKWEAQVAKLHRSAGRPTN